jgi:GNAT superfamily N-acetyltransferase
LDLSAPVRLAPSRKRQAVEVLVRAFVDDAGYEYVFPDVEERLRSLRRLWPALLGYGLLYGEVYTTPDLAGVAIWLAPGKTELDLRRAIRTGFALPRAVLAFGKDGRRRFGDMMNYNDDLHRRLLSEPHWYLGALGVDPARQGQGVGSALLQPILARAAAEGLPCYLEAINEQNAHFYEKRGFTVVHEGEVLGHPVKMWAMVRRAR